MKNLALLILRTVMGMTLIAHGYTKLFGGAGREPHPSLGKLYGQGFKEAVASGGPSNFAKTLESKNIPAPDLAAYASGLAEFGGGLALLTGTMTRFAALAVLVNMIMAIRTVHWEHGFYGQPGFEYPAQLAGGALAVFIAGPGALSVDGLFNGVGKAKRAAADAGHAATETGQAVAGSLPTAASLRQSARAAKKLAA